VLGSYPELVLDFCPGLALDVGPGLVFDVGPGLALDVDPRLVLDVGPSTSILGLRQCRRGLDTAAADPEFLGGLVINGEDDRSFRIGQLAVPAVSDDLANPPPRGMDRTRYILLLWLGI
jgi:hypothetical protein